MHVQGAQHLTPERGHTKQYWSVSQPVLLTTTYQYWSEK